jgi:predicted nucleic acid-binding protein
LYLLDTNIISLLEPRRRQYDPVIFAWLEQNNAALYLSTITLAEIQSGIRKLSREGKTERAEAIAGFLGAVRASYSDRILAVGAPEALVAGDLLDLARSRGRMPGVEDILIGATAKVHGLVVLTRNVTHFAMIDVDHIDPTVALPDDLET